MAKGTMRGGTGFLILLLLAALTATPTTARGAIETRAILKTFFETGDVPTQDQFGDLIDSYIHQTDDGLTLFGMGVLPDPAPDGAFLRLGANVGINQTMPDTYLASWRPPPRPNIPPIPGMNPSFRGQFGFLPLEYSNSTGTETHFGFLQISMADSAPAAPFGDLDTAPPGPAIYVEYWAWESTPGATLTTFVVPEPTAAAALLLLTLPMTRRRRAT